LATGRQRRNRRRQERLRYEDAVAWAVVPIVLIVIVYGAIELTRQLAGTPFGKLLGW